MHKTSISIALLGVSLIPIIYEADVLSASIAYPEGVSEWKRLFAI
jgi:hypothetical protein